MLFELESKPEEYLKPTLIMNSNVWKICGFKDVYSILHNPDVRVSDASKYLTLLQNRANQDLQSLIQFFNGTLIFKNNNDHDRGRNFLKNGLLTNSSLVSSTAIKRQVKKILASTPLDKEIDAISSICNKISASVMGNLLGLETETCEELTVLSGSLVELWKPMQPISKYIQGNLIAKNALEIISRDESLKKHNYVLSSWFSMGEKNYILSKSEISALLLFLFIGGKEEASAFLGNALLIFLTEPELTNLSNFTEGEMRACTYEMLRFCGPIRMVGHRFFSKPKVLSGIEIPAYSPIECNVELAHFDPNIYENPCTFNPRRNGPKPIVFGGGIHGCLGRRLAITEAIILLQELSLNYKIVHKHTIPEWESFQPLRKQRELPLILSHK